MIRTLSAGLCAGILMAQVSVAQEQSGEGPVMDVRGPGPRVRPGFPDAFAIGYNLPSEYLSPDKRFGVIVANSHVIDPEVARNFIVSIEPFRILAVNEGFSCYKPGNHRDMAVQWVKDSSAVLVTVGGKWGTIGATLFELRQSGVTRRTDIMAGINAALGAKFPKKKAEPYNDSLPFILDQEHGFELDEDGRRIRIDVEGTNNPNRGRSKTWRGIFKGVWSVPEARWVEQSVTAQLSDNKPE